MNKKPTFFNISRYKTKFNVTYQADILPLNSYITQNKLIEPGLLLATQYVTTDFILK